jgi:hypothetical protein
MSCGAACNSRFLLRLRRTRNDIERFRFPQVLFSGWSDDLGFRPEMGILEIGAREGDREGRVALIAMPKNGIAARSLLGSFGGQSTPASG